MARYIALLRGINVGGHRIKMDKLRGVFEELGVSEVSTFIASGNVIFTSRARDTSALERKIESHLKKQLGYPVATFVRTPGNLQEIASAGSSIRTEEEAPSESLYVIFLQAPADATLRKRLAGLEGAMDSFRVAGREIFWHIRGKLTDSAFFGGGLEKAMAGAPTTTRNMTTVRRLSETCGADK